MTARYSVFLLLLVTPFFVAFLFLFFLFFYLSVILVFPSEPALSKVPSAHLLLLRLWSPTSSKPSISHRIIPLFILNQSAVKTHPCLPPFFYFCILTERIPCLHVGCFSPVKIMNYSNIFSIYDEMIGLKTYS